MLAQTRGILLLTLFLFAQFPLRSQITPEENNTCLKCHSAHSYSIYNEWTEQDQKRLMNPYYILDTMLLKAGVHHTFKCIDCHAYDYSTYPHNGDLKLEPMMTCIDCHGGDETYASYQFERIEEEFQKSIHFEKHSETFTCTKCHSQHYYKPTTRTSTNINEIVEFSNNMCLSCHNSNIDYQLISEETSPKLIEVHSWLPNQNLHFQRVRCIECHTEVHDTLLVSHHILPKAQATKNCIECHSTNSKLQASLYKYRNLVARSEDNNIISNEYYVIGAYRNKTLNYILLLILAGTLSGIIFHIACRTFRKK